MTNTTERTTAERVLAVLHDTTNYFIHVEYCFPERVNMEDKDSITNSADTFRRSITLHQVEEEMEECRYLWADEEPHPMQVASFILDTNADHGVYQTITISLEPSN